MAQVFQGFCESLKASSDIEFHPKLRQNRSTLQPFQLNCHYFQ
jgi:hypothetical protein